MTMHFLHEFPEPPQPKRQGQPWTDDEYATLIELCRRDVGIEKVCEALGRKPGAVLNRAKRMLPMDERGVPAERVLSQLRKHLLHDADYDWEAHLAALPPPRPVINHVHPPAQYAGIEGLEDAQLLTIMTCLVHAKPDTAASRLADQCGNHIRSRQLTDDLMDLLTTQASDFVESLRYRYEPWQRPYHW
ncbi:hypothetical protein GCM10025789_13170 [Tessaracoccus lubricantis]|uniref:Uncharacterized protein n=1 Tax=Tessaracoccus lubricantis TaxID=545543 RepID=A0ABP9FAW0_9ACTN